MNTKGKKRREPGVEEPLHDRYHPSDDEAHDDDDDDSYSSSDLGIEDADTVGDASAMSKTNTNGGGQSQNDPNTGINHQPTDLSPNVTQPRASQATDRTNTTATTLTSNGSADSSKAYNKQNKRTEERKHRGLMQWKPARNMKFAKDEAKIGMSKLKKKVTGGLDGRQPGVETGKFIRMVVQGHLELTCVQKPDSKSSEVHELSTIDDNMTSVRKMRFFAFHGTTRRRWGVGGTFRLLLPS
jgi:hypothetical protein